VNALLGLERVYAELGWSDSLVAPVEALITASPREETYRTVQLRTLQSLGRDVELRRAVDAWVHDMPNSVSPYREYARRDERKANPTWEVLGCGEVPYIGHPEFRVAMIATQEVEVLAVRLHVQDAAAHITMLRLLYADSKIDDIPVDQKLAARARSAALTLNHSGARGVIKAAQIISRPEGVQGSRSSIVCLEGLRDAP
jgi:hypothetical protein